MWFRDLVIKKVTYSKQHRLVFISESCVPFVTNVIFSNIAVKHNTSSFKKKRNREGEGESKKQIFSNFNPYK